MGRVAFRRTARWPEATIAAMMLWLAPITASAQTFTILHSFDGTDGNGSLAGLIQGTDGNLYGTTDLGGAHNGNGTVFKITPGGVLTTLYDFCAQAACADGSEPRAGLVQGTDGNFYGTTYQGGSGCGGSGCGTLFKVTPAGLLTTLYDFCSATGCADGSGPDTALVQVSDGNFYGTTLKGGAAGFGTVFKITPAGTLTTIYSFCALSGCADGATPEGALVQGSNGDLYGTTYGGGLKSLGTAYKISPTGTLTTLYSFCSQAQCPDGQLPVAGLVQATNGSFYGTTSGGGVNLQGTVYKTTPTGITRLYNFCSEAGCADGRTPYGTLIQGTDGNLYGNTLNGGLNNSCPNGCGTVFKISPNGVFTGFSGFCSASSCPYGQDPDGALLQDTNGKFYGTTSAGGANGHGAGTVYSFDMGFGPFVKPQPAAGSVGKTIVILGTNLVGATSVTFNGIPATFTVAGSGTAIRTTVPGGATTGPVQVVTPSGTLSSNVNFQVLP